MTILYVLAAVLLFGILITVHEAGHFFAARMMGIPVREFAIGFGPKLLSWTRKKHETKFFLRAIPLGGYCAFYGEDDTTGEFKDDPRAFANFSVPRRLLTIIMGPVMNLVLALVVAVVMYTAWGVPKTLIHSVEAGSPAQIAGLMPQDRILSLDGKEVDFNLPELLEKGDRGAAREIKVLRKEGEIEKTLALTIIPEYNQELKRVMIGIQMSSAMVPGTLPQIIRHAGGLAWEAGSMVVNAIIGLVTRGEGAGEVAGVVGITKVVVDVLHTSQLQGYLYLMVVISINLGLMNLLIIPGLDGSRILFLLLEGVRGKPIKKEGFVHAAGMVLLFALMIFITFRDVIRLF